MWSKWSEETVRADFEKLSANNIKYLRIFPLWSDFQPLKAHYTCKGELREIRFGEIPLDRTPEGIACIDPVMGSRFARLLELAKEFDLKLIVGLITGWMSGRLLVPPALEGKNIITDPLALRWELRFVKYMVRRFKDAPAIVAWDLGNECNCLAEATKDEAYLWSATIANAIKCEDQSRPVVSGMHSLIPSGSWTPEDQGEVLDILCTHPYPLFTPYCDTDPINEEKSILHSTAETVMYADLSGKPAFAEEMGTLGTMISSRKLAADYIRAALWSLWAHDCRGFMWWCANEQSHLENTPYDWESVERELGFFDATGKPKPVLDEISKFASFIDNFEYSKLPRRITDAVCILSKDQDTWAAAYGSFILAKEAGVDIGFAYAEDDIPDADAYILPCVDSGHPIYRNKLQTLLEKVKNGSTLFISLASNGLLSGTEEYAGIVFETRSRTAEPCRITPKALHGTVISVEREIEYKLTPTTAEILATDQNNNPVFCSNSYGNGKVYLLTCPLEYVCAKTPGINIGNQTPLHEFYRIANLKSKAKRLSIESAELGITEHILNESERLAIIINYTPRKLKSALKLEGYRFDRVVYADGISFDSNGDTVKLEANGNCGAIIKLVTL